MPSNRIELTFSPAPVALIRFYSLVSIDITQLNRCGLPDIAHLGLVDPRPASWPRGRLLYLVGHCHSKAPVFGRCGDSGHWPLKRTKIHWFLPGTQRHILLRSGVTDKDSMPRNVRQTKFATVKKQWSLYQVCVPRGQPRISRLTSVTADSDQFFFFFFFFFFKTNARFLQRDLTTSRQLNVKCMADWNFLKFSWG